MGSPVEHLVSINEGPAEPHIIYDPSTFDIIEANRQAVEIYGFTRSEFMDLSIKDLQSPSGNPELYNYLSKSDPENKLINIGTFRHQNKDGDTIHIQTYSQSYKKNGRDLGILYIHHLNDTAEPIQNIEQHYYNRQRQLYHNPLAMIRLNHNFGIVEWSDRAEEKTGYSRKKMVRNSIFDINLFANNKSEKVTEYLQSFRGDKSRDRFEATIQLKNGNLMHVLIHASALHDKDGNLKSILAFIQNIDVRKQYLQHIEEREQRYHRLFEHASDAIALLDGFTIVDCNEKLVKLLDAKTKESIIGKSILDFSTKKQQGNQGPAEKLKNKATHVTDDDSQVFDWNCLTSQGEKIFTEISLQQLMLEDGDYLEAVIRNVTERRKAQNLLKQEQERMKHAQKLANLGWWGYDLTDDQLTLSDNLMEILNIDEGQFDFTLDAFKEIVHPDDHEKMYDTIKQARHSPDPVDYMLRIKKSESGEIIHGHGRAMGEYDENGKLVYLSGVLQDISEYREAQKKIIRQKKLFESLFLDSPVAIAMIDTEGTVKKINKSYEKLFGYTEEELVGNDLVESQLPENKKAEIKDFYQNLFEGTPSPQYIQDERITKNGTEKHLIIASIPISIEDKPIGAFDIYTDITKLRKTQEKLQDSLEEKEILLSEIHHRVKNNLAIISGLLELEAMDWEGDTQVHNALIDSKMRIHSMASIHEQLYKTNDFSNISVGKFISGLVDTISNTIYNSPKKDINISISADDILLNINQALPSALIINELVTHTFKNALEEDKKGDLDIIFRKENNEIILIINDGEPGSADDFEVMVEESLGHQLVGQLVKQLNGDIDVINNSSGTRYKVTFQKEKINGSAANQIVTGVSP